MWRRPDEDEFAGYAKALQGTVESAEHWQGRYDPDTVIRKFVARQIEAVVIDEAYLLVYVIAPPWYNERALDFYELGVFRISKQKANFVSVTQAMEGIARQCGATRVNVGNSAAAQSRKELVISLYKQAGFEEHATALLKEL